MKKQSFRRSLIGFILLMIVLMVATNVYSMIIIKSIEGQYSNMIGKMLTINEVGNDINLSVFYFDKYFTTKSKTDMDNYEKYYYEAISRIKSLKDFPNEEISVNQTDLNNIIENYHRSGEKTIYKFMLTQRNEDCYKYFIDTKEIASYSGNYIERLNNSYLKYNENVYKDLRKHNLNNRIIITVFLILITLFCIVFSIVFSKMVTVPVGELAEFAEEISKGNFEIQKMVPSEMYEIDVLRLGFNKMVSEIKLLIEKINGKAAIEMKLNEQELKNLLVENMLKETQLKMLQSQINPHFLFNTLNAIVQTSIIEEAYETEKLINAVSELLRYSLSMIDRKSIVANEIGVIKQYIYIQETRFKDRVKFNIAIDKSLNDVKIPGMILQPLVENAFIHGIESSEVGGEINVTVYKEEDYCIIKVEDNGAGMSKERLSDIMSMEENQGRGHATGIGVKNVIKRLKIMYMNSDVFSIESSINNGTRIYIKIPVKGEE